MAQGQLGLYGPRPAEIQPAAQRVKARVYDSGPGAPRPDPGERRQSGPPEDRVRQPPILSGRIGTDHRDS